MRKGEVSIRTKHCRIVPMSDYEMEQNLERYHDVLTDCKTDPKNRIWYAPWKIILTKSEEEIGSFCFHGPVENDAVEIIFHLLTDFEEEVIRAIKDWAFSQDGIYFIEVFSYEKTESTLTKIGFAYEEASKAYVIEREAEAWMPIYMCLGMSMGLCLGVATNNQGWFMSMGVGFGVLIGYLLDKENKKKREVIRANRLERLK